MSCREGGSKDDSGRSIAVTLSPSNTQSETVARLVGSAHHSIHPIQKTSRIETVAVGVSCYCY